jgi:alpha-beta hydrolase superfamily lysophospholipase
MAGEVQTFEDYVALEERVFTELVEEVYDEVETGPEFQLVRYSAGSAADPSGRQPDYNRTFEFRNDSPRGGVLLLHGMSDSPYSLHEIGETLHEQGYWVIGLRLPGHGTAPSGIKTVRWQDMAAATQLAMQHLGDRVDGRPLHIFGYSNGAALALNYTLDAMDDAERPMPSSLVLVSPAIGVTRFAALAGTKAGVGRLPGFGGSAWLQVTPEFDPYKYNSFPANAGAQVHSLTRRVGNRIASLARTDSVERFPPILVFKSTVDATVAIGAVVDRLLGRLPDKGNEFILFDINRSAHVSPLIVSDPGPFTRRLMSDASLPFTLTLITNEHTETRDVVAITKPPFSAEALEPEKLGLAWPQGVISLSHVALPFSPEDPLYGRTPPEDPDELFLGQAEIRGERGMLKISTDWLLRLRYNPFYEVFEARVIEWLDEQAAN